MIIIIKKILKNKIYLKNKFVILPAEIGMLE